MKRLNEKTHNVRRTHKALVNDRSIDVDNEPEVNHVHYKEFSTAISARVAFMQTIYDTNEHRLAMMGRARIIAKNGQWASGCTAERPRGWERTHTAVREVEAP